MVGHVEQRRVIEAHAADGRDARLPRKGAAAPSPVRGWGQGSHCVSWRDQQHGAIDACIDNAPRERPPSGGSSDRRGAAYIRQPNDQTLNIT